MKLKHIKGLFNLIKLKSIKTDREDAIRESGIAPITKTYPVNEIAKLHHPYKQYLVIDDIIEETKDVKSFILKSANENKSLAPFKAGSHISIYVNIGDKLVSRTYSLSSSPIDVFKGIYRITIKRVKDGILSNYMLDKARIGDTLYSSEPGGFLTYTPLRDGQNVIAIAGGSGITPFISMAKAINDKLEFFRLTILYCVNKKEDIIFKDELDYLNKTDRINVVYIFKDEEVDGHHKGYVTADIIKEYMVKDETTSIFGTGPRELLDYLAIELPKLNLEQKYIRLEQSPIYLKSEPNIYNIKVHVNDEIINIKASSQETILQAFENNNLSIRTRCHLGGCGFCRSKLIKGEYEATKFEKIKEIDKKYNYIHPCCSYPRTDMEIEIYEY